MLDLQISKNYYHLNSFFSLSLPLSLFSYI